MGYGAEQSANRVADKKRFDGFLRVNGSTRQPINFYPGGGMARVRLSLWTNAAREREYR
jgi:hypothetical protein